jgi:hypothetical protein
MHDVFRDLLKRNSNRRLPGLPKLLGEGGTSNPKDSCSVETRETIETIETRYTRQTRETKFKPQAHFQPAKAGVISIHELNQFHIIKI